MLTPTGVTSSDYWGAIKAGNQTHIRITFLGQNITLDDSDISTYGVSINDMFNGETDIVFGKAVSKQVTMSIINTSKLDNLIWTGEFTLEFGVDIGTPSVTNWVKIGYFTGLKPKNVTTVNVIEFVAYDRMTKFDQLADAFFDTITYPITVQGIYDALCANVGIANVSGDELPDVMSRSFASAPIDMKGYTCRDIIAWIAEACGCYARITANGECKMVWFTDNTSHSITGDEEYNVESGDINDAMIWNEADTWYWNAFDNLTWDDVCGYTEAYNIDQIQTKNINSDIKINYPYQYGGNVYTIVDNPFLTVETASDITNYIAPLYNRMHTFGGYVPANVECIGCWLVESGDIVSVEINGNSYNIPIFVRTLRWNGAVDDSYETTGNRERSAYSDEKDKQVSITSKYIRLFVEDNYYHTQSGIGIDPNGIVLDAYRYIQMLSGSSIDIESGANINVKTGADLNILSGANIDIESGGNINVKSGGNIDVESGGNMKFESGGSLDIKSGGSMYIRAGGVFDVQATNFIIDSINKYMRIATGDGKLWEFNNQGLYFKNSSTPLFNLGTITVGDTIHSKTGIFYDLSSLPNDGRLVFTVSRGQYYNGMIMEHSDTNETVNAGTTIYPFPNKLTSLGKYSRPFDYMFSRYYYGEEISNNGYLTLVPKHLKSVTVDYFNSTNKIVIGYISSQITDLVFSGTVVSSSSKEIKHDIVDLQNVGDVVDKFRPVSFVYDNDANNNKHFGLIYEEVQDILPEICNEMPSSSGEITKSLNYVELVPILLKEIQSLRVRVKALEEREVV